MSFSYSNWLSATVLLVLLCGCAAPGPEWTTVSATDNGGYSFSFPWEGGVQDGSMVLGVDTVPSHVNIVADSGLTYVSGWFTLSENMLRIPEERLLDSLWQIMPAQVIARSSDGPEILLELDGQTRKGWFMSPDSIRFGIALHQWNDRVAILSVGTPEFHFGERQHRNMERFLRSFKLNDR